MYLLEFHSALLPQLRFVTLDSQIFAPTRSFLCWSFSPPPEFPPEPPIFSTPGMIGDSISMLWISHIMPSGCCKEAVGFSKAVGVKPPGFHAWNFWEFLGCLPEAWKAPRTGAAWQVGVYRWELLLMLDGRPPRDISSSTAGFLLLFFFTLNECVFL